MTVKSIFYEDAKDSILIVRVQLKYENVAEQYVAGDRFTRLETWRKITVVLLWEAVLQAMGGA